MRRLVSRRRARGMVLLTVLATLAVLLTLAAATSVSLRTESRLAAGEGRRVRAQWLAEAGLQRAALALRDRPETYLALDPEADRGLPVVLALDSSQEPELTELDEGFTIEVSDESARLDLNSVSEQVLNRLLPTEPALAAAILDWRDDDDVTRADGAEGDFYLGLTPPYVARNGPFETEQELLLVRGVTPARYFGQDGLSPLADQRQTSSVEPNLTPLAQLLGLDSQEANVDAQGQARINLRSTTAEQLTEQLGELVNAQEAQAMLRWAESGGEASAPSPTAAPAIPQPVLGGVPFSRQAPGPDAMQPEAPPEALPTGEAEDPPLPGGAEFSLGGLVQVIPRERLQPIFDRLTVTPARTLIGLVNVNTAPAEVLAALPGLDENLAQTLVAQREQAPFETVGDLLSVAELSDEQFQRAAPWLTTRGQLLRVTVTGRVGEGREMVTRRLVAVLSVEPQAQTTGGQEVELPAADGPLQRVVRLRYRRVD